MHTIEHCFVCSFITDFRSWLNFIISMDAGLLVRMMEQSAFG
jgi:hypothetical protein